MGRGGGAGNVGRELHVVRQGMTNETNTSLLSDVSSYYNHHVIKLSRFWTIDSG